jgi:hypothetical protein
MLVKHVANPLGKWAFLRRRCKKRLVFRQIGVGRRPPNHLRPDTSKFLEIFAVPLARNPEVQVSDISGFQALASLPPAREARQASAPGRKLTPFTNEEGQIWRRKQRLQPP